MEEELQGWEGQMIDEIEFCLFDLLLDEICAILIFNFKYTNGL